MIHWVLTWDRGGARGYPSADQEAASAQRAAQADYVSEVQVTVIREGIATLTFMMSSRPLRRGDIVRLAHELHRHGIREAYADRRPGRNIPFGKRVESGPMAGMSRIDVMAIVAGDDGDY